MLKNDLVKFVSADGEKHHIDKPWSRDGFTYATNGHVMVRVPVMADVQNNEGPNAEYVFKQALPMPDTWVPIPDVKPSDIKCDECGGQGRKFRDVDGITWERECDGCNGSGKIHPVETHEINGVKFQVKYLFLLHQLPNCEISPVDNKTPAWFKFDGGEGLLMPMEF
jgi:hypothetical protein